MGNDNSQKSKAPASSVPVRPVEVKAYVMACQTKMSLYRNKKVYEIKKKKDEAIAALKQNNLDIAKAKMESIIRLEDMITVYDILGPLCEIIKERITYICEATEVPPDIKAQLDTVIYASSRIDIDELYQLRSLVQRKYGNFYIQAADSNKDGLVNVNVVEKLRIKPPVDAFLTIRLKQLCKEKKVNYEFPEEIAPNFDQGFGQNPFGGNMGNPYENNNFQGGNMGNPYENNNACNGGNPFNPQGPPPGPQGNNNMGGNDFDAYMKNQGNPYGGNQGGNPYEQGGNNPYVGGNPYEQGGNNPYGGNTNTGGNPYEQGGNNPYGGNQGNQGGNPFEQGNNPYGGNQGNQGGNPFEQGGNNPYNNNSNAGGNNPFGGTDTGSNNPYQ